MLRREYVVAAFRKGMRRRQRLNVEYVDRRAAISFFFTTLTPKHFSVDRRRPRDA